MKDPQRHIRTAYLNALKDRIILKGAKVPVVDFVMENQSYPYLVLSEQTANDSPSAKDCTIYDTTMLIDIVTGFDGSYGGKEHADRISEQVLAIVIAKHAYELTLSIDEAFQIKTCRLEAANYLTEKVSNNFFIVRKLLRIRNLIEERNIQTLNI